MFRSVSFGFVAKKFGILLHFFDGKMGSTLFWYVSFSFVAFDEIRGKKSGQKCPPQNTRWPRGIRKTVRFFYASPVRSADPSGTERTRVTIFGVPWILPIFLNGALILRRPHFCIWTIFDFFGCCSLGPACMCLRTVNHYL